MDKPVPGRGEELLDEPVPGRGEEVLGEDMPNIEELLDEPTSEAKG